MENIYDNYLNIENNVNQQEDEDIIQTSDERKSKIIFNEIIDDLIRKKTSKENELKNQIEKNKKNLLEKFYSLSNASEPINNIINTTSQSKTNSQNQTPIINPTMNPTQNTDPPSQFNPKDNIIINNINKNNNIPNNINPNLLPDGQKEYDEIREKYKNERNKKKSSIFKSEDLRISNTNSVHLKKEDFSPINPNIVNQETKNNILIIQKKLFGDSEANEETSKVENIDEIDDLDFDDINIKEFKNEENPNINNNINLGKTSNSNINLTNLDTNNINFDLSSNLKSELNDNENNFFPNEILVKENVIQYFYYGNNKKDLNNKYDKFKDYKKIINRTKNFSVQLVSKLDYYIDDDKNNFRNKKRKGGSNQEVMNEMNNFIKNLIPTNMNNNINDKFNGNEFNYEFDKINNNININNINNNININDANLAKIISQQQFKQNKNINMNNNKNINKKNNIIHTQKNGLEHILNNYNTNSHTNKNNSLTKKNKNSNIKNINKNSSNNIINKIQKQIQKENNIKNEQNYKRIMISQKPLLKNLDIKINQNIQKANTKLKMNYRHISNSNIQQINKNNTNINSNNQTLNNIKHKRKNNSVIIKRDISKEQNDRIKEIYLLSNNIYNNKIKEQKKFYHFNTNNNLDSRKNSDSNLNEINQLKNNIKNIINQIPSLCKNPMTTKNKKISMSKIIKKKLNINNLNNSNGNNNSILNNNGINSSNSNNNTDTSNKNKKKNSNINVNVNVNIGNKFAILNTIHKNNLIKYTKLTQQIEAINKLKQHLYSGIYFIYVEKINEGFLFKGIYKRGASEINPICNKIYGVQNTPLMLSYEKFLILTENNKKEFIPLKLSSINLINYSNSILLVRND